MPTTHIILAVHSEDELDIDDFGKSFTEGVNVNAEGYRLEYLGQSHELPITTEH